MFHFTASEVSLVLQIVVMPVIGLGVKALVNIYDELRRMNGSIIKLQTWANEHEKDDISRDNHITGELNRLWEGLEKLRERKR